MAQAVTMLPSNVVSGYSSNSIIDSAPPTAIIGRTMKSRISARHRHLYRPAQVLTRLPRLPRAGRAASAPDQDLCGLVLLPSTNRALRSRERPAPGPSATRTDTATSHFADNMTPGTIRSSSPRTMPRFITNVSPSTGRMRRSPAPRLLAKLGGSSSASERAACARHAVSRPCTAIDATKSARRIADVALANSMPIVCMRADQLGNTFNTAGIRFGHAGSWPEIRAGTTPSRMPSGTATARLRRKKDSVALVV